MIAITRDGTKLRVEITGGNEVGGSMFGLTWEAGTEWAARLLVWHLGARLSDQLTAIRQEAYANGWKDAKAKKGAKRVWFSGWWK